MYHLCIFYFVGSGGQPQEIAASGNLISTAVSTIPQTPSTSSIVTPAKSSPKPPQRSRNIADANRTPLFDDEVRIRILYIIVFIGFNI